MSHEPPTCPYCNALVPVASGVQTGQRVPCPRCGEAFTLRRPPAGSAGVQVLPAPTTAPAGVDCDVDRPLSTGRNKRITAAAVLGVMGLMATVGLAFALYTVHDRRVHDTAMPPPHRRSPLQDLATPTPTPTVTPPADLEALRWLPPDDTVVAGVQVAELRQTDSGRDLLNHLFRVGRVEVNADLLERWTGLKPEEIDHVVLGVQADEGVPPPAVLVVRTMRPYDAESVRTALGAEPVAAGGKTLYRCKPGDGGLRPWLWCADERTLVFGLFERQLEAIPDKPAAGLERLPAEVRTLLNERLDSAGPAWVVGRAADWRKTAVALLLGGLAEKDADLVGHVREFALQLQAERPARLMASVRCDDADAARALETRLMAAKPADADWKAAREGPWLTLQLRGDPAGLFKDLGK